MATIYFTTDQSGANTEICTTQSSVFNFSASAAHTVAYANLVVKKGSTTSAAITVAIYTQANGAGSVLASATIPAANISQNYTATQFNFPANTTLTANQTYSLKITSTTGCGGSSAYFFKAGNFQIYNNDTAALLSVGYGIAAAASATVTATARAAASYPVRAAAAATAACTAAVSWAMTASAAFSAVSTISAALSALRAGAVNKIAHGPSLIGGMYAGGKRVKSIRRGTVSVLAEAAQNGNGGGAGGNGGGGGGIAGYIVTAYESDGVTPTNYAGTYCEDGTFTYSGTGTTRPKYRKAGTDKYIYWLNAYGMNVWALNNDSVYSIGTMSEVFAEGNADTPPTTGWYDYLVGAPITVTVTTCS